MSANMKMPRVRFEGAHAKDCWANAATFKGMVWAVGGGGWVWRDALGGHRSRSYPWLVACCQNTQCEARALINAFDIGDALTDVRPTKVFPLKRGAP